MMRRLGMDLTVRCDRGEVLERLKKNRARHSTMVAEARAGYLDKATVALTKKLDDLRVGKLAALTFSLAVPVDYTRVYDTAIGMLEAHTETTIELGSTEFSNLMLDDWEWLAAFTATNSQYSGSTREYAGSKGLDV